MDWNCTSFCTSNLRRETFLIYSDKWLEFFCPFGRKELDIRKSSEKKTLRDLSLQQ